jgi:fructokinase
MLELLTTPKNTNDAVKFAAACGALTTLKPGAIAAQPTLEEVEKLVEEQG